MRALAIVAVLTAAAVGACSKSSTSPLTDNNNTGGKTDTTTHTTTPVDLTTRVNELLAEMNSTQGAVSQGSSAADVEVPGGARFSAARSALLSPTGPSFTGIPNDSAAACTFDSTAVRFNCPPRTLPGTGMIHIVSFRFVDSTGKAQTHFDTIATMGLIRWTADSGTYSQPVGTSNGPVAATQSSHNTDSTMLTGLHAGQTHTQNGAGHLTHTIVEQGVVDTAFITAPTTNAGIQTSSTVPYPVAGSSTAVVHTVQGKNISTTTQVTSFNGTSTATLVITFTTGGKRTCTYDMTSPAAPVCTGP